MSRLADVSTHAAHVKERGVFREKEQSLTEKPSPFGLDAGTRTDQSREQGPAGRR
jgi:hypothetical protein